MSIELKKIDEEEFNSGGSGKKTWNHSKIQEFVKNAYDSKAEKQGDRVMLEFSENDFYDDFVDNDLSYEEWINETEYPHPTVKRQLLQDMEKAGFEKESQTEKRKHAVGGNNTDDGYVIKMELIPQED